MKEKPFLTCTMKTSELGLGRVSTWSAECETVLSSRGLMLRNSWSFGCWYISGFTIHWFPPCYLSLQIATSSLEAWWRKLWSAFNVRLTLFSLNNLPRQSNCHQSVWSHFKCFWTSSSFFILMGNTHFLLSVCLSVGFQQPLYRFHWFQLSSSKVEDHLYSLTCSSEMQILR